MNTVLVSVATTLSLEPCLRFTAYGPLPPFSLGEGGMGPIIQLYTFIVCLLETGCVFHLEKESTFRCFDVYTSFM